MTDFLAHAAARSPEREALTDGRRSWSYRALDRLVGATARGLGAAGARPGRTVAVVLGPSPEAVVAVHAVLRTGALLAPLGASLTPEERNEALGALSPLLVLEGARTERVGDDEPVGVGGEAKGSGVAPVFPLRRWWAGGDGVLAPDGMAEVPDDPPEEREERRTGDAVAVLWTSGTGGVRRGVLLGEAALRHSAEASRRRLGLRPGDRWHASLSVAHVGGLALVTRAALLGATLVADGAFRADHLARLVDEGGVTHASLVPTMLRRLLDDRSDRPPPRTLRCLLVGGAACPPSLVERSLRAGMPVALTYGLTEATSQVATAPPEMVRRKPDSVGPPLDGVELRVDGSGEIAVRGPTLALGLLDGEALVDGDGWLRTGDLGALDAEGHLRVLGRRAERIVSGGVNVDPSEVEAVLLRHPAVAEAAVVGFPDPEWGERVVAAVVVAGGDADPDVEAIRAWLGRRLSGARVPKVVVPLSGIPRNANGKVDRGALKKLLV